MKYFSMFSGIGGFELGIQNAYKKLWFEKRKEDSLCGQSFSSTPSKSLQRQYPTCIGFSEVDKYAVQIYEKHFKEHKNYGDCTGIDWKTVPDFDLLVGGFPCQAFSIAGKRAGFKDTRGTLFFEIARCLKEKQPRLCLLENVKGLLSHDKGTTFATILTTLSELGYDCQWKVLNSKDFGVPQNRERVFIVGHLRGTGRPEVFPFAQSSQGNLKYSGGVISAREQWLKDGKTNSRNFSQGQRIYSDEGISQTLAGNAGGQGGKTGLYAITRTRSDQEYKESDICPPIRQSDKAECRAVLTPDRTEKRQNGRRMKENGEPSFTLTSQDQHGIYDGYKIRRLTPTECERLQGFPDGWTEGISDTQRYKCLGNAVTVNVVEAIIRKLIQPDSV